MKTIAGSNRPPLPSTGQADRRAGAGSTHDRLVSMAVVLLFPGYFLYHVLVAQAFIPAFVGGYSSAAALIVMPFVAFAYARKVLVQPGGQVRVLDFAFLIFVCYFAAIVLGNLLLGASERIAIPHLGIVAQFLALFLLFSLVDVTQPLMRRVVALSFGFMSAVTFLHASDGAFKVLSEEVDAAIEPLADYQGYAFVYFVLALLLAASSSLGTRLLVYLIACPALYLIEARSEFVGFLFGAGLIELLYAPSRPAMALFGLAGVCLFAMSVTLPAGLPESRILSVVRYSEDQSAMERSELSLRALEAIGRSPVTGEYAGYAPGEYAHNLLSAWVDLGLVGFAVFLGLLFSVGVILLARFRDRSRRTPYVLALTFVAVELLLALAAKNFTYQLYPIALALAARELAPIRKAVRHEKSLDRRWKQWK